MADKVITLRDAIPVSVPTEQSFVADWANFSKGGAPADADSESSGESDESQDELLSGSDSYASDQEDEDGRSASGATAYGGDHPQGASTPSKPGFLSRVMNPFRRPDPQNSERMGSDDNAFTMAPRLSGPGVPTPALATPSPNAPDAAREIVEAFASVTRSSSGDSIADLLDQIATSLRAIEVATRGMSRSSNNRPDDLGAGPPRAPVQMPRPAQRDDQFRRDRDGDRDGDGAQNRAPVFERPNDDRRPFRDQDGDRDGGRDRD